VVSLTLLSVSHLKESNGFQLVQLAFQNKIFPATFFNKSSYFHHSTKSDEVQNLVISSHHFLKLTQVSQVVFMLSNVLGLGQ
jgi:hypothetical protein